MERGRKKRIPTRVSPVSTRQARREKGRGKKRRRKRNRIVAPSPILIGEFPVSASATPSAVTQMVKKGKREEEVTSSAFDGAVSASTTKEKETRKNA